MPLMRTSRNRRALRRNWRRDARPESSTENSKRYDFLFFTPFAYDKIPLFYGAWNSSLLSTIDTVQGVQHISSITKLMRILLSLSLLSITHNTHTHTHRTTYLQTHIYRCSRADDCSLPSPRDLDRADVLMDTFLRDPSLLSTARNSESKLFSRKVFPCPCYLSVFMCVVCYLWCFDGSLSTWYRNLSSSFR